MSTFLSGRSGRTLDLCIECLKPAADGRFPHHHPLSTIQLLVAALAWLPVVACAGPDAEPAPPTHSEAHTEHGDHEEHDDADPDLVELGTEAATRAEIRTAPVEERTFAARLRTTGHVDFDQNRLAHVSPRITGRVHRVTVTLGEQVHAGQKLAEVDSIELGRAKATFLQAVAHEELERTSFDRVRGLLADRIVSEQSVLEAEVELRQATAELRTAEETLRLYGLGREQIKTLGYQDGAASIYPLRAPFDGTVIERHAALGELVTPERNLFTLADLGRVWIWIDVHQRDLGGVHLGDRAKARVDAFPDRVFEGEVSYLSARVDADTRTLRARLDVENPEGALRPGMFVDVELADPHGDGDTGRRPARPAVPADALVRDGDAFFVFVALGERRFERRPVGVGSTVDGFTEILHGVVPGEPVVVAGTFLLKSALSEDSLGGGHSH